jgi:hypothetical protein
MGKDVTAATPSATPADVREPFRLVLTGGPCGGKTSALARIRAAFEPTGYKVLSVPEASTSINAMGFSFLEFAEEAKVDFEIALARVQRSLEDETLRLARLLPRPAIVVCDRGIMDLRSYCPPEGWPRVLASVGAGDEAAVHARYDAVLHLRSAAVGAEEHYTLENNPARTETPERARELDHMTEAAWRGHPAHHVIDNSTHFDGKMARLVDTLGALLGAGRP